MFTVSYLPTGIFYDSHGSNTMMQPTGPGAEVIIGESEWGFKVMRCDVGTDSHSYDALGYTYTRHFFFLLYFKFLIFSFSHDICYTTLVFQGLLL